MEWSLGPQQPWMTCSTFYQPNYVHDSCSIRVYCVLQFLVINQQTVYRANEVNVHAALRHENILPLVAVLMGERHEHHKSKFYCFHFMPVMDCDLRQILSAREVGCLKHFYTNCSKEPGRWETGFNTIKFILGETLKALIYLHDNGYVHRDVKGH